MSRIAVFFAEGFEEIESLTVIDLCRRAGMEAEMVSVTGQKTVTGSHRITIETDKLIEDADFSEYDMLVLPGGMPGTKNLEACIMLMKQLDTFYVTGKTIGAICAAPSIFGHRGYLKEKRACSYPGFEGDLTGAIVSAEPVVVSGNVITSRGLGTAIPFALTIVTKFCGSKKAEELEKSIVYR